MKIPEQFDPIRPFEPDELPDVFDRLLQNEQFCSVLAYLYPDVPKEALAEKMHACKDNLDFQKTFCYGFLVQLLARLSKGCDIDIASLDTDSRYTFISNHRDIVLDSALLDKLLIDAGFNTTCEIAIGDNLLKLPWVKDLVRVNKSFIVERALSMREMLMASKRLSEYMHFVIAEKNDNVWIAQREGRAKDSNDRTQEAILKMMVMGGEGSIIDRLKQLHLVPLAISYEYDPCDYLKAAELQARRDNPCWQKGPMDDVTSMQTGIMGYKGYIHYQCADCIDSYLDTIPADTPKTELFRLIADHIDRQIFAGYRLYPNNYVALDLLHGDSAHADHYTAEDKAQFEAYLKGQLDKIEMEGKDDAYLREQMLKMYANPAINQMGL
ncbi:1-acyl-sn-glycerol-3-phosphate acyltransferase [Prevotella dentalis]|uniref:1-acyl-sn-glycerol-3-phosphate acyltransferase n=1 Tax=Prevotella dentalis TaxID=52227 RepID=UPI00265A607C|nr:1-acyl-sn-glycerol-3-phosphate acyltransferase [Prevotella dentalis]MCF2637878.1 1-acyl-sn-glycerol-3-phosphate acyltransferase [Prevotella dentalis]